MRKICAIILILAGGLMGTARADTFKLEDGQTITGDVVSCNESGMILRLPDGKYSERVIWTKLSQEDLKQLGQNPRYAPLVEPFLEIPLESKPKPPPIQVKTPERLDRSGSPSLLGAMFSSSIGLVIVLLLYGANIYAAYEIAIYRAQPRAMVCGLAAIPGLGVLAPIIFLAMPTRVEPVQEQTEAEAQPPPTFAVPGTPAPVADAAAAGNLRLSQAQTGRSTGTLPTTQVFQRGAFTFNRRFFETKFPGFFGMLRRDADKEMVLLIKTSRGQYIAQRITRIAANDIHVQVPKGPTSEEVAVSFTDIQEVQLKHKDA